MEVAIVGLGLMGGSLSLSLQQKTDFYRFIGVDSNELHCATARQKGIVEKCVALEEALKSAEVVVLTTPVDVILHLLPAILDMAKPGQVIIDFGSTKERICQGVKDHPNRHQYVAAHPMAGTENTGPEAAIAGLYDGRINILCEKNSSGRPALETAGQLFLDLSMKTIPMDAASHDKHVAYISHLSHVSSFMLGRTVLEIEKDEKSIFNLAGSGFQSTVRLAMSSPEMWAPIFSQNAHHVSTALNEYIHNLQEFKRMIDSNDQKGLLKLMGEANDIRRVLKG